MTTLLTDADVRAAFDWPGAVAAVMDAYAGDQHEHNFPSRVIARGDGGWLRVLAGASAGGGPTGAKIIAANTTHGRASYLIALFDPETTELVALLDGNSVTGFRTAATSALAVDLLGPGGPLVLGVLGSGFEAQHHVRALAAMRDVTSVSVFSPSPDSRRRFVDQLDDLGIPISAVDDGATAVKGVDIVVCAARSRNEQPILHGAWLEPGMTVVSIGSTLPEQREVDEETLALAAVIVADQVEEVTTDTGDLIAAARAGIEIASKVVALGDVVAGRNVGRSSPEDIVIYKSVGAGVQDLAVAALCLARARERSLGTPLPATISPVSK